MTVGSPQLRYWIDMALECVRRDHTNSLSTGDQRGPFLTARALGMGLAALHDANALASTTRNPLLSVPPPPNLIGSNPIVAGAAACYEVLSRRYPQQVRLLDPAWARWEELYPVAGAASAVAAGKAFGQAVHALGVYDPSHAVSNYTETATPYRHIKPPNEPLQGYAGSNWGDADVLVASRPALARPPGRVSATQVNPTQHFKDDFAKVAAKGESVRIPGDPADRSLEEEVIGIFWGYDGPPELGTPPRLYMQIVLNILDAIETRSPGSLDSGEELAIIAAIGVAMADAGIHAWHYKYSPEHMMWRPVVGIPGAVNGNGTPIPGWLPMGRPDTNGSGMNLTPNFPAYPSGHATFGSAAFQLLRLFLVEKKLGKFDSKGVDDVAFDFTSDEYNGRNTDPRTMLPREHLTRRHTSLWQAIVENSLSRVYLGVHWQFDGITTKGTDPDGVFGIPSSPQQLGKIGGVWLGGQIANSIAPLLGVKAQTIKASRVG